MLFEDERKMLGKWSISCDDVRTLLVRLDKLRAEHERLLDAMHSICRDYCQWYDKGLDGMNGGEIAYHLVGHARAAIQRPEGE